MIPDTISDIFQAMNDFFYGLDVEIRPKLTPSAGTPRWALAAIHPGLGNRLSPSSPFLRRHRELSDPILTSLPTHLALAAVSSTLISSYGKFSPWEHHVPNRVNRAHGTTKENRQLWVFFCFVSV